MSNKPIFKHCGKYTSFFRLIDEFWLARISRRAAHRICTVMRKMGAQSVVIEEIEADHALYKRIKKEQEAVKRRLGEKISFKTFKMTFLSETHESQTTLNAVAAQKQSLGYLILINVLDQTKPDKKDNPIRSYIYESIVIELGSRQSGSDRWIPLNGHYLHVKREFDCSVLGMPYRIKGSFFTQQNGITSVCAHACLVMMLNNVETAHQTVYTEDINELLSINHIDEKFKIEIRDFNVNNEGATRLGLHAGDVKFVVESFKYEFFLQDFRGLKKPRFRQFLYGFIESGFPSLLSFITGSHAHVVAIVGHTLNSNSWLPLAVKSYATNGLVKDGQPVLVQPIENRHLSSLAWVDDFLVHDDNLGMELSLPAHAFHDVDHYVESLDFIPEFAVGIIPSHYEIKILPPQVEYCVAQYLMRIIHKKVKYIYESDNYYVNHLLPHFDPKKKTVVLRVSLVSAEEYIKHLNLGDNSARTLTPGTLRTIEALFTKKRYWLAEVSEPDLYIGNRAKVIDVLVDPTFPAPALGESFDAWLVNGVLALKFPEFFMSRIGKTSEFDVVPLETSYHCTIFGLTKGIDPASVW